MVEGQSRGVEHSGGAGWRVYYKSGGLDFHACNLAYVNRNLCLIILSNSRIYKTFRLSLIRYPDNTQSCVYVHTSAISLVHTGKWPTFLGSLKFKQLLQPVNYRLTRQLQS